MRRTRTLRTGWGLVPVLALWTLFGVAAGTTGCAGSPATQPVEWPKTDVLPAETPDDLETDAPSSVLSRGSDGFLYAVGGVPKDAKAGTPFLARYSGDWPLEEMSRPPLAAGRVVEKLSESAALVHLTYRMPETDLEGLELTWEESVFTEQVGKGLLKVSAIEKGEPTTVSLETGKNPGLQPGDIYAIVKPSSEIRSPTDVQLSHRFKGICVVDETGKSSANCRMRSLPNGDPVASKGDTAVFLEHVVGERPRKARVQVGNMESDSSSNAPKARSRVVETFEEFVESNPEANVEVEAVDSTFEATRRDFHRVESEVEYAKGPQIVVGLEAVDSDKGSPHLVVNYTGVGPATGPGMVAAPPTGGVDLGPIDRLDKDDIRPFVAIVWAGAQVYRGQTSSALAFLHHALSTNRLAGPLRWHARDQYAMRWAALGNSEESLWLVLQDEAAGAEADDREARLNAMGTRVRLYDFVGLSDQAVAAAESYLEEQQEKKPGTEWLSALGMLAELQAAGGRTDEATRTVEKLRDACPDGCGRDLFSYLSSVWWSIPDDENDSDLSRDLLADLVARGSESRDRQLAAARLYQGVQSMRDEDFDQALIGFLESARLYEKLGITVGVARARYFEMIAEIQREKFQNAYETGQKALELRREVGDFEGMARIYNRLSSLYANLDFSKRPEPYLQWAKSVLTKSYESQRARGSYGKAGESLYTLGTFLFKFGEDESARSLFRKAVGFSISSTRFDVAALSHLYLAMIARRNKDRNAFTNEIERARTMAEIADSPEIQEAIERALNPNKERDDVPTQML